MPETEEYIKSPNPGWSSIQKAKGSQVRAFGDGIKRAFSYVTTFVLPYPGGKVTKSSAVDGELTIGEVDEEFLDAAKKLFRKLFIELPQESRQLDKLKRGSATWKRFKALKERTVDSGMSEVKIKTAAEALQESLINQAFISASQYYDKEMNKAYEQVFDNSKEIEVHLFTIVKDTVQKFEDHKLIAKYKDSKTKRQYRTLLLAKGEHQIMDEKIDYIEQAQATLRAENEFQLKSKKLKEEFKELNLSEKRDELSIARDEEEKKMQQEEWKSKRLLKENSFSQLLGDNAEADGIKLSNVKSERNKDLMILLQSRDQALKEEQNRWEEQLQELMKTAEKIKRIVESDILSEEETWIDTAKINKSSRNVM